VLDPNSDLARPARKWVQETTRAQGRSVHLTGPVPLRRVAETLWPGRPAVPRFRQPAIYTNTRVRASGVASGVRTVSVLGSRLGFLSGWWRCSSFVTRRRDDRVRVFRAIRPSEGAGTGLAPACWPD
jgi:hypothetical protein